ncbi:MAG: glycosyltransferase family 61 protein, partial [Bdellovibrionales bacterium]|nr:glycosyltransferase family 61 protein [Bdellovibrionales bacterium]
IEYHTALTQSPSELTPLSGLTLHAAVLGGGNFYHFFMEALPKLFFAGKWLSEIDHLLIDKPCHPNQLAWLEPLSLSCEVHELTANTNFLCEHVLFTSRLVNHVEPNPWVVQSLREAFLPLAQKRELPSRIVVASRKNAATRSDHGISQLVDALPEAELIAFDELSPADIVTLCQQIKVFIGCHGAAFANTVFLPRDAIVVEICQTDHYPYYVRLSQVMGLKHYQIRLQNDHWSEVIDKVVKLLVC